ncbi:MAG: PKD domain-containing protein [Opitutales bacterium]|nr:PKD domain-containing protein [Opitutales bacterium]
MKRCPLLVCLPLLVSLILACSAVHADQRFVVTYAGAGADTRFTDVRELSDGTLLVAGVSANLNWIDSAVPRTELSVTGLPAPSGTTVSFIMRLSGDTERIPEVVHLPAGAALNLRWMRSTEVPGDPTGTLYVSGQVSGGYFIGPLNNNFVQGVPDALNWVHVAAAANGHEVYQAWDVGNDGRVVFAHGGEFSATIGFLDPAGNLTSLPALRASHWVDGAWQRGLPTEFPTATHSAIRLPTDNQSWNDAELFAITPDGNGGIRQGTWPIDIMVTHSFDTGDPIRIINNRAYGYNGYRTAGRHWIGAVTVDRRNNNFYYGFNIKSIFWDAPANKEQPDFEPAVIAYHADGSMMWWSRLYTEALDTTGDGLIDTTFVSPPDQYIDGLEVDYSVPLSEGGSVVVVARCHGNNTSNFWSGNAVALNPGANGFQNRFTGTEGNIHISWIGRLRADDGNLLAATYLAGFFRRVMGNRGNWPTTAYPEPIHDGWPHHNAGWPDVTTTRTMENSTRIGPDGRVFTTGLGPRMVTTSNAMQKLPRRLGHDNPILNEGTSPWNRWVRVYEPMLNQLAYSSALTGVWTYPDDDIDAEPVGAANTVLSGIFPVSGGLLVVGHNLASGNDIPTAQVPEWGVPSFNGISGIFALKPFSSERPFATFSVADSGSGPFSFDAAASESSLPVVSYLWDFGDGRQVEGEQASHAWTTPGRYLVTLRILNSAGLEATSHRYVDVTQTISDPIAHFSMSPQSGTAPLAVEFDASASIGEATLVEYRWDWNNDGTADHITAQAVTNYTFVDPGVFTIGLTVVDDQGRTASTSRTVTVADPTQTVPVAVIAASTLSGEAPLLVNFDGSGSYVEGDATLVLYEWDWNANGTIDATGETASHTFAAGNHLVRLTVTDSNGHTDSAIVVIEVTAAPVISLISINFGANSLAGAEVAGVVPASNWNNVTTTPVSNLKDANGIVTQAVVEHNANPYTTADDPTLSGDHRMMSSYRGTQGASITVTVSDLPTGFATGSYDVIVYFGGSRNETFLPRYTIGDTSYVIRDTNNTWDGVHRRSIATTSADAIDGHNYVRFEGVSGTSFILNIDRSDGAQRYGINGMQIVLNSTDPEPEPHPYLAWLVSHGLGEGPDTAPGASFLKDGVPNLLKYLAGIAPTEALPEAFRPHTGHASTPEGERLLFTYRSRADRTDVECIIEESTDLASWLPADMALAESLFHEDGTVTHTIHSQPIPSGGAVFIRLRMLLVTDE